MITIIEAIASALVATVAMFAVQSNYNFPHADPEEWETAPLGFSLVIVTVCEIISLASQGMALAFISQILFLIR